MTPNKIILFFLFIIPFCASAQFGLGKKRTERTNILNSPTVGDYTLHDPEYRSAVKLMDGYPDEKSAWIVYSDRDNNTTFQNPGNEKQTLASLNFMQACFVIGEKDDYVELAEYVPRVNMSKGKKTLENAKYLGWVNKNTLLLWNRALKDKGTNYYLKTITAFGTQRIFDILQHHVTGDSIITFANPFLNKPLSKCGMENIFYIYKESVLGNEYLVGPDPNFLPENSAQSGIGWVSKDLIRVWGTKGFVSLNPDLKATLPFYQNYPSIKNNIADQEPITIVHSPYTTPKSDLEKLYPIIKYSTTKDGDVAINSSLLEDVLDKDKNRVYNISGDLISNEDIETFSAKSSKLNIVLVVSAGRKNGQYINNLQGVLETDAWREAARNNFKEVNIGAVVYKDYGPNCDNAITPLTNDYRAIDEFLQEQRKVENDGCDDNIYYQGMYGGIIKATKMLQAHNNESNIILVYGSGSDETSRKGEAIRSIQSVKARLFFFQTHNIPNEPAYINFVGDAKELISKSAENITELKKKIIVPNTYPNILNSVSFVNDSTGRIQQLDYPRKAITQGFLLFPHDSENMPAKYLADYLDSLITTIAIDNRTIESGLHSAMAQSSSGNTKIKKEYAYRFPKYLNEKIPLDFLKSNTLRNQNFLIPAWMLLRSNDAHNLQTGLTAGVLLSEKEYTDFANQLALLGGNGYYDSKELIVKQVSNAIEKAQSLQNTKLDKSAKELTFSEALGFVSGYFPVDPAWRSITLSEYQSSGKISIDIGRVFLDECRSRAVWLHDHNNNANLQIRNNGRTYYIIDETHLPVNTVINSRSSEKNTTVSTPTVPDKTKEKNTDKDRIGNIGSVINDYNNNPAQTKLPDHTTPQKSAADIAKAKTVDKKDAGIPSRQDTPTTTKAGNKQESGNINKVNEDLNTAPSPAGANTAKKENKGKDDDNKTDTVNYRKRIAAQELQKDKSEQPGRNNADLEHDLKQLEKNNAASTTTSTSDKPISTPKVSKKAPPKRNADFEKDLMELQGSTNKNAAHTEPKQATTSKVSIKKDNANTNSMQEDLDKIPVRKADGKSKKESTTAADTVNYRNQISKQKTTEK
ncbi:MAG: type VI secretion system protein TssR domain-containing protein [Taibaiella sp.]|jgi:hypothetical protein